MESRDVLPRVLFLLLALLDPLVCLDNCDGIGEIGTDFSVTSLECMNYTAQLSWSIEMMTGTQTDTAPSSDTIIILSCSNESNVYSPDIPSSSETNGLLSYVVPLTGTVQCSVSGCYETRLSFEEYLIPTTTIVCSPPPLPSTVVPSSMTGAPSSSSSSPSPYPSISLLNSSISSDTNANQTKSAGGGEGFDVVIVTSLSVSTLGLCLTCSCILLCIIEGQRRSRRGREKLVSIIPLDNKVDPTYHPKLGDHNQYSCGSSETIFELLAWKSTNIIVQYDTPSGPHGHRGDSDSLSNSTNQDSSLPSLSHNEDVSETTATHPSGNSPPRREQDSHLGSFISTDGAQMKNRVGVLISAHHPGRDGSTESSNSGETFASGSSYVREMDIQTSGEIAQQVSSSSVVIVRLPFPPVSSNTPSISEREAERERSNRQQCGIQHSPTERETVIQMMTDSESESPKQPSSTGIERVLDSEEREGVTQKKNEPHLVYTQSNNIEEFLQGQNGDEDEVVRGFAERFVRRPEKLLTTHSTLQVSDLSSGSATTTSSGPSTGCYLEQWPTAEH